MVSVDLLLGARVGRYISRVADRAIIVINKMERRVFLIHLPILYFGDVSISLIISYPRALIFLSAHDM